MESKSTLDTFFLAGTNSRDGNIAHITDLIMTEFRICEVGRRSPEDKG